MSVIENYNEILNSVKEVSKQANHHVDILAVSKTQCGKNDRACIE